MTSIPSANPEPARHTSPGIAFGVGGSRHFQDLGGGYQRVSFVRCAPCRAATFAPKSVSVIEEILAAATNPMRMKGIGSSIARIFDAKTEIWICH
jgi:hypothetical protein